MKYTKTILRDEVDHEHMNTFVSSDGILVYAYSS